MMVVTADCTAASPVGATTKMTNLTQVEARVDTVLAVLKDVNTMEHKLPLVHTTAPSSIQSTTSTH